MTNHWNARRTREARALRHDVVACIFVVAGVALAGIVYTLTGLQHSAFNLYRPLTPGEFQVMVYSGVGALVSWVLAGLSALTRG